MPKQKINTDFVFKFDYIYIIHSLEVEYTLDVVKNHGQVLLELNCLLNK